jgi:hypothetical protein
MYNQYDEARKNQSQATDESKRQEGTSMCSCGCRISHVLCTFAMMIRGLFDSIAKAHLDVL